VCRKVIDMRACRSTTVPFMDRVVIVVRRTVHVVKHRRGHTPAGNAA
jgi:hypothetical protein